jgi:hypothetical protein
MRNPTSNANNNDRINLKKLARINIKIKVGNKLQYTVKVKNGCRSLIKEILERRLFDVFQ